MLGLRQSAQLSLPDGRKLWEELTAAEPQQYLGDYEAMVGQGAMARHSEEHLASMKFSAGNWIE